MAEKWLIATGNVSVAGNWNGSALPATGDDCYADGFTGTVDANFTVASIRTSQRSGGTAGGGWTLAAGVTLTAAVIAGTTTCLTRTASGASSSVVGSITGGTGSSAYGLYNNSTANVVVTGSITGGSGGGNANGIRHFNTGQTIVTGNVTGGTSGAGIWIDSSSSGLVFVTGNVTGGSGGTAYGIQNAATQAVSITGNISGGTASNIYGLNSTTASDITISGNVTGGAATGAFGVNLSAVALVTIGGDLIPSSAASAIASSVSTARFAVAGGIQASPNGYAPYGGARLSIASSGTVTHAYATNNGASIGASRTLTTAGADQAATTDVRSGVSYGGGTGSLIVPSPSYVASGVPTDNTVGSYTGGGASAADIADAVWDEARSGHVTAGTFGEKVAAALDAADKAALVDLIWDEPLTGATHNVATSSGKRLRQTTAFQQIDSTVIDAAATTTTFITGLTSSVDDFYNDSMLVFTDGALAGQVRAIYDYIGATKTIILEEALTSAPVNGVAFAIVSLHIHPVSQIQSGLATADALATESTKLNRIEAVATGTVTGAGTSTEVFVGPSATLTITVDSSGNRSAVVVT